MRKCSAGIDQGRGCFLIIVFGVTEASVNIHCKCLNSSEFNVWADKKTFDSDSEPNKQQRIIRQDDSVLFNYKVCNLKQQDMR